MNLVIKKVSLVVILFSCIVNSQSNKDSTAVYLRLNKFEKAIDFASKHKDYNPLFEYGQDLFQKKEFKNALPLLINALEIGKNSMSIEKEIGINYYIAGCYLSDYDFKAAIVYFQSTLKLIESHNGHESQLGILCRNNLGNVHLFNGDYQKAEMILLDNLKIIEKVFGRNNKDYAETLMHLADLQKEIANYSSSESYYLKALEIRKQLLGEKNPDYVILLKKLADLYSNIGKKSDAEKLYLKSKDISLEIFGKNSLDYADSLIQLGGFYLNQKKYSLTEYFYFEALTIQKQELGRKNIYYITTLNDLSTVYFVQEKYERTESIRLKVLEITKEIYGEEHLFYASSLEDLADFYQQIKLNVQAENFYDKALKIYKNLLGIKHPDYLTLLGKLSNNYFESGQFSKAEKLDLELIETQKEILGENHPDYLFTLFELGTKYFKNNNYTQAEYFYQNAVKIYEDTKRIHNQTYLGILSILANMNRIIKSNDKASFYFEKSLQLSYDWIFDNLYGWSENELIFYANSSDNLKSLLPSSFSFIHNYSDYYPKINILSLNHLLFLNNLSTRNKNLIKKSIQKTDNKLLQKKYELFISNINNINKYYESPLYKRPENFEKIQIETEQIEKELFKESLELSKYQDAMSFQWLDLKSKLSDSDIYINIIPFKYLGDTLKYSAFLIKKDSKYPKFIPLFEEKQLSQLLAKNKQEVDSTHINNQYTSKAFSDLFLKPLENELNGVNTIYFSPSGLGHQIDFAALPISENETFGEKYKVHILSSPAEMIDFKSNYLNAENDLEIVLYGGIDYNKTALLNGTTKIIEEVEYIISDISSRSNAKEFGYLNGTKNEIDIIESKATKNNFKTMLFEGREATEESIKQLDGRTRPFALHLATHGFFFPDPEEKFEDPLQIQLQGKSKIYKASDDPMMRSGLILAGANKYWGKPFETLTTEDGILTASEISNLDLSACQLVVLSACETGLGEIKGSEGVFGLQRAFKMAGVKNIIMSLWKVPDTQTAMLFDVFYEECFKGKSIHEAFRIAQSTMKEKYPPYYWAGFVLLE